MSQEATIPTRLQPQQNGFSFSGIISNFGRMFFLYFIISSLIRYQNQPSNLLEKNKLDGSEVHEPILTQSSSSSFHSEYNPLMQFQTHSSDGRPLAPHSSLFYPKIGMDLRVYITETKNFSSFQDTSKLVWHEQDLEFDFDVKNERSVHLNYSVTPGILSNSSVYAHIYLTREGYSPNPKDSAYLPTATIYKRFSFTTYRPAPKKVETRKLLDDQPLNTEEETEQLEETEGQYISYWIPSLKINPVYDFTVYQRHSSPPPFYAPLMEFDMVSENYFPVVYLNDFWVLEEHLIPINSSIQVLPLELSYYSISLTKLALYVQTTLSFENQKSFGTSTKKDADLVKRMILDTNPILLVVTMIISVLHSLFDFLAFKNDVSFWRNQQSLQGLSIRTIALNAFFQLVIFLYLLDNDTSYMILISSGISFLIELWKIKKATTISYNENGRLVITGKDTYTESSTALYDRIAVTHLSYIMYPLVVGYAIYSLLHASHKGWYSWILSSLTGFVYAFGFIMMTPQLYINYRLKSVAHLPWRAMVYKSLNTFIDDLFAFVIKMPIMHRLSCFRDDIIFFIYLYQKWIYPVDKQRVNEFGQVAQEQSKDETLIEQEQNNNDTLVEQSNAKTCSEKSQASILLEKKEEIVLSNSQVTQRKTGHRSKTDKKI